MILSYKKFRNVEIGLFEEVIRKVKIDRKDVNKNLSIIGFLNRMTGFKYVQCNMMFLWSSYWGQI